MVPLLGFIRMSISFAQIKEINRKRKGVSLGPLTKPARTERMHASMAETDSPNLNSGYEISPTDKSSPRSIRESRIQLPFLKSPSP